MAQGQHRYRTGTGTQFDGTDPMIQSKELYCRAKTMETTGIRNQNNCNKFDETVS
jgi:hypothetical protein